MGKGIKGGEERDGKREMGDFKWPDMRGSHVN